jgi:hypothetical protein
VVVIFVIAFIMAKRAGPVDRDPLDQKAEDILSKEE